MTPIITLTMNACVDTSASVETVYANHNLRCEMLNSDPGGGGINVARVITRLGGNALALYCGGGVTGDLLQRLLEVEKVPQRRIAIDGETRQNLTVLERATSQQYRFVMPGPKLAEPEWDNVLDALLAIRPCPDLIVASGSLPPGVPDNFYATLAGLVRERGSRLILDTCNSALSAALKRGVFLIKPSLREFRSLVGQELVHEGEQEEAATRLVNSGRCEAVVVSLGAAGVLFANSEGCERMRSPTVAVRSSVGAGDSMVAGIAFSLARGSGLREAVRFGVAAGAAAVMNAGTELCRRADVERLLNS